MVWQDVVISIANIIFSYSIFRQVYHGFKRKKGYLTLQTSFLTSIGLFAMTVAFFSLNLIFSTIIAGINGILWFILFLQSLSYPKV